MKFELVKDVNGCLHKCNLELMNVVKESYDQTYEVHFAGYLVIVSSEEYVRIMSLANGNEQSGDTNNKDVFTEIKDIVFKAPYLNSDAKLSLIMDLENIKNK